MIDSSVQVAIVGGIFTITGYCVGAIQKTVERYIGQKHFQKSAIVILRELRNEMEDVKESIDKLKSGQESQRAIMKQLLTYAKQQSEAANQITRIVEDFVHKTEADSDSDE